MDFTGVVPKLQDCSRKIDVWERRKTPTSLGDFFWFLWSYPGSQKKVVLLQESSSLNLCVWEHFTFIASWSFRTHFCLLTCESNTDYFSGSLSQKNKSVSKKKESSLSLLHALLTNILSIQFHMALSNITHKVFTHTWLFFRTIVQDLALDCREM